MSKVWKPIAISSLFDQIKPGKAHGANHLKKSDKGRIGYIGATNRNNGVLFFVDDESDTRKLVQEGHCVGFIKNGDGSAGYAIYKEHPFISTSDVIYGYSKNELNRECGLFLVVAQDMIRDKYSHGHKRNKERLLKDKIMLPISNEGLPDFDYMEQYVRERETVLLERYFRFARMRMVECEFFMRGDFTLNVNDRSWVAFPVAEIFTYKSGKENNMGDLTEGNVPLVSAKNINNGLKGFVSNPKSIVSGHCITLNKDGDGGAGLAYYQPFDMALDTHVIALWCKEEVSKETLQFIAKCLSMLHGFYGHGLSISEKRLDKIKIMLPTNEKGRPDYEFMDQYVREREYRMLEAYLKHIDNSYHTKA